MKLKLKWQRYGHVDGSHASLGDYRVCADSYAPNLWKASVWSAYRQVGFRAELSSELAAKRAAESLMRGVLRKELRRLKRLRRRLS
jgi:hypothetical protein